MTFSSLKKKTPACGLCAFLALAAGAQGSSLDVTRIPPDLVAPQVTRGNPAPGKRVLQALPGYETTKVRHALYLPTDWREGRSYPVIAEFTGNNGTVAGGKAAQGYGISGGEGYLWVTLPFVSEDGRQDMDWWWGDPDRTADYAKAASSRFARSGAESLGPSCSPAIREAPTRATISACATTPSPNYGSG